MEILQETRSGTVIRFSELNQLNGGGYLRVT
jgi:hypothetical protein